MDDNTILDIQLKKIKPTEAITMLIDEVENNKYYDELNEEEKEVLYDALNDIKRLSDDLAEEIDKLKDMLFDASAEDMLKNLTCEQIDSLFEDIECENNWIYKKADLDT